MNQMSNVALLINTVNNNAKQKQVKGPGHICKHHISYSLYDSYGSIWIIIIYLTIYNDFFSWNGIINEIHFIFRHKIRLLYLQWRTDFF